MCRRKDTHRDTNMQGLVRNACVEPEMRSSGRVIPWALYRQPFQLGTSSRKEQHRYRDRNAIKLSYSLVASKNTLELRYDSFIDT